MDDTTTTAPTLTYAAAAARWQVSERTIARLVAAGEVTAHTKPTDRRRRLVSVEEVAAAALFTVSVGCTLVRRAPAPPPACKALRINLSN